MMYYNQDAFRYMAEARIKRLRKSSWRGIIKKHRNK